MKNYLLTTVLAILLSVGLIIFDIKGLFPLRMIWSSGLLALVLLLAFWSPRQTFWIFISLLPLESIVFLSLGGFISLRPFQVFGGLLVLVVLIRMIFRKSDFVPLRFSGAFSGIRNFLKSRIKKDELDKIFEEEEKKQEKIPHFNFFDFLIFVLPVFAFLSIVNSPGEMLFVKQALVLTSFIFLYWLTRNYIKNKKEKFEAVWFFVIGSLSVIFYGIFQAVSFQNGWADLEVFNGRINSTFTEPDWLGMYLVFLSAIAFWLKFLLWNSKENVMVGRWSFQKVGNRILDLYLLIIFISLILTVARSAWIGFTCVVIFYFLPLSFLSWRRREGWSWNILFKKPFTIIYSEIIYFVVLVLVGMGIIYSLNLSSFHLGDRAESSFSGMQKITVSCEVDSELPEKIQSVDELGGFGCSHINLEDIDQQKKEGLEIKEIYRPDPNIKIRKEAYRKTWEAIKNHWVIGQGIGSSSKILGLDENGAGLNASNIFLEAWVSIGVFGLAILILILFVPVLIVFWRLFGGLFSKKKELNWAKISFVALVFMALVIPNLFNAGWLLGFLWVALAFYMSDFSDC